MMAPAIDDRRSKDFPPVYPGILEDPWLDWKPLWTGKKRTPQDRQEQHSPTEPVTVRLTAERQVHRSKRRIVDGRLWDAMTPAQQDAALILAISHEMMGRGMGYVSSNWQRIPGCRNSANVSEAHARMINFYIAWAQQCARQKISHSMVADVLYFGFSCRMIDHDRRLKTGSTRDNLMRGLSLYCDLRGWRV
ncbi:MAG: hypothetical protein HY052_05840 [Proteobacteria bacterium]|nr:hypothetical protein [Pseudomonadota bacterium]